MAGSSLLALIDDIATLLDDVATMTGVAAKKTAVAAKKTAGVLGDDLALNAQQVAGVRADRELPVVWAVFKGSAVNKAVLVPCALLLSAFLPWLITPLLMLGGAFLCYEGFEKVAHALLHARAEDDVDREQRLDAVMDPKVDMVKFERRRIKGAIRTDAILSHRKSFKGPPENRRNFKKSGADSDCRRWRTHRRRGCRQPDRLVRNEIGECRITLVAGTRLLPQFKGSVRQRVLILCAAGMFRCSKAPDCLRSRTARWNYPMAPFCEATLFSWRSASSHLHFLKTPDYLPAGTAACWSINTVHPSLSSGNFWRR